MYYFAYGSNMCTPRLARRVPAVEPVGPARLAGHRLAFDLAGRDGSGKCNVTATGVTAHGVYGVLFALDGNRLAQLHAAEGAAYAFVEIDVRSAWGLCRAAVYRGRAQWRNDRLLPYCWYRAFVVAGAREHGLPADYIRMLEATRAQRDPDRARALCNTRILAERPANVVGGDAGHRQG